MSVKITGNAPQAEQRAYADSLGNKYNRNLKSLHLTLDRDYAHLTYQFEHVPFERIRRITGYLVGTMDQWNNAKAAEEADRVKHSLNTGMEAL